MYCYYYCIIFYFDILYYYYDDILTNTHTYYINILTHITGGEAKYETKSTQREEGKEHKREPTSLAYLRRETSSKIEAVGEEEEEETQYDFTFMEVCGVILYISMIMI